MKKYTGSIVKRGDSFHWRYKTIDGKYTTRTIKHPEGGRVTTMVEAERIVSKWSAELTSLHQLKSKEEVIQHIAEVKEILTVCKIPIGQIETAYFDHPDAPDISLEHRKNYHSVLKHLIAFMTVRNVKIVSDVTEQLAQEFLSYYWKRGISTKTYNSALDVVRRVFRVLCKDRNPFADFKKKTDTPECRDSFTFEQLQQIWDVLKNPNYQLLHKEEMIVLYKLAIYTGARKGDLCLLKWSSVDLAQQIISFTPHKTSKSSRKRVMIPMSQVLFDALKDLPQNNEYVLPKVALRYQTNPGGISRDTKKLLLAAGITPTEAGEGRRLRAVSRLGFHSFRHFHISQLIANGVNPLVVRDLVGHTTVDMTARYTHVALETKQQAVCSLMIPTFDDANSTVEGSTLAECLQGLSEVQSCRLARWLEAHLSPSQKRDLYATLYCLLR